MHEDLLRRALESKKTVSRSARSKHSSTASSRAQSVAGSRANSRIGSGATSRNASDDEDDELSDGTAESTNSIDKILASAEAAQLYAWEDELANRIALILDRKRSSVQGREDDLAAYIHILRSRYVKDNIEGQFDDLLGAFVRSIRAETSEKEALLALKAIQMSAITNPTDDMLETCSRALKSTTDSSSSPEIKSEAIQTNGILTFLSNLSDEDLMETMNLLLEIVESDGTSVEADDSAEVVTAALEVWGLLATQVEDLEDGSSAAMEAFVEQLDSSEPSVQVAAGENIALLYEKSWTEIESDEELSDSDINGNDPDAAPATHVQRYDPYRRKDLLVQKLDALANASTKRLSKKNRKTLHVNFASIRTTVLEPTKGPKYSAAINDETDREYGSRMAVKLTMSRTMRIDRWWKLHRLKALRRVLKGGFLEHYENNGVVLETLPVLTR